MSKPPRMIDYPEDRTLLIKELSRIASDANFAPSVAAAIKHLGIRKQQSPPSTALEIQPTTPTTPRPRSPRPKRGTSD